MDTHVPIETWALQNSRRGLGTGPKTSKHSVLASQAAESGGISVVEHMNEGRERRTGGPTGLSSNLA
jgi:hypothetical protein